MSSTMTACSLARMLGSRQQQVCPVLPCLTLYCRTLIVLMAVVPEAVWTSDCGGLAELLGAAAAPARSAFSELLGAFRPQLSTRDVSSNKNAVLNSLARISIAASRVE